MSDTTKGVTLSTTLLLAAAILPFSHTPLLAEPGDAHTIRAESAKVMSEPSKLAKVVVTVPQGSDLLETDRQGDWIEVYIASDDIEGWVHRSSIDILGGIDAAEGTTTAPAAAADTPAAEPVETAAASPEAGKPGKLKLQSSADVEQSQALKDFQKVLIKYNAQTYARRGYTPFLDAVDKGSGVLNLTVSEDWAKLSDARKKSTLIVIYSRWKTASGNSNAVIHALNTAGEELMVYSR